MTLLALLRNGYLHRAELIDAGWSSDRIRRAARAEGVELARRTWLLGPDIAPALREAALAGGQVTCRTALTMFGLWSRDRRPPLHLALPPHSGARADAADRIHRALPIVPRDPRSLVDRVENVLAGVALCLPHEDALAVWDSALRTRLLSPDDLARTQWRTLPARRLAEEASELSHSGLETRFVTRMRRAGVAVRRQVFLAGHWVDSLIGARLVVQLDGFAHHSSAAQRRSDVAHDRALRLLGYTVLRYTYDDVMFDWPRVERDVLAAIAQGLHLAR